MGLMECFTTGMQLKEAADKLIVAVFWHTGAPVTIFCLYVVKPEGDQSVFQSKTIKENL